MANLLQTISATNHLISLCDMEYEFGSFHLDEASGHIIQKDYTDFISGEAVIRYYSPNDFTDIANKIKSTIYEKIQAKVDSCNYTLQESSLTLKYGSFLFDFSKEIIQNKYRGFKVNYSLSEGLKLISEVEDQANQEILVKHITSALLSSVIEAEAHHGSETSKYEFGYYEGMQAYIMGTCHNTQNWSHLDIIVYIDNDIDNFKQDIFIQKGVPVKSIYIEKSIRLILKKMKEREGPNRAYELLMDITNYYKNLS